MNSKYIKIMIPYYIIYSIGYKSVSITSIALLEDGRITCLYKFLLVSIVTKRPILSLLTITEVDCFILFSYIFSRSESWLCLHSAVSFFIHVRFVTKWLQRKEYILVCSKTNLETRILSNFHSPNQDDC